MIEVEAIKDIPFFGHNVQVTNVNWNLDRAIVEVYCPDKEEDVHVFFNNQFGSCSLRLLDEVDLSDDWAKVNMQGGWLYQVKSGGWFDMESRRQGYFSKNAPSLKEYLILGRDMCVSAITKENVNILNLSNAQLHTVCT